MPSLLAGINLTKESEKIYTDACRRGNRAAKLFVIYLIVMPGCIFFLGLVGLPIFNYYVWGNRHPETWFTVYKVR